MRTPAPNPNQAATGGVKTLLEAVTALGNQPTSRNNSPTAFLPRSPGVLPQARRQWDRVLRHSGKRLASWTEAIKWERGTTGDLAACRRLYARSLKEVQDFPEVGSRGWIAGDAPGSLPSDHAFVARCSRRRRQQGGRHVIEDRSGVLSRWWFVVTDALRVGCRGSGLRSTGRCDWLSFRQFVASARSGTGDFAVSPLSPPAHAFTPFCGCFLVILFRCCQFCFDVFEQRIVLDALASTCCVLRTPSYAELLCGSGVFSYRTYLPRVLLT